MRLKSTFPCFLLLVYVFVLLLALSSCDPETTNQTAILQEEETIAVVNNKKISLAKFQARLYLFLQYYRDIITTDQSDLGEIKNIVINKLIDEELINQEAARKGIQVSEAELDSIMAESLSSYEQTNFASYLQSSNLNEEQWKERLRQYLVQKKLIEGEVINKIPITKREIKSYFQKNKSQFGVPQALRVRNITLSTEEEAKAIRSQLLRGKSMKELIKKHSISPDKSLDGDLGYISRGDLPEEMESAIFSKRFNKFKPRISEVVRSQDGFHVFSIESYRESRKPDLNVSRQEIKQILIDQKFEEFYAQWIKKLKGSATITIDEKMLQREEGF